MILICGFVKLFNALKLFTIIVLQLILVIFVWLDDKWAIKQPTITITSSRQRLKS